MGFGDWAVNNRYWFFVPLEQQVLGVWYTRLHFLVIIINSLTLAFGEWHTYYEENNNFAQWIALDVIAIVCSFLFVFDTVIKFYAFTVKGKLSLLSKYQKI